MKQHTLFNILDKETLENEYKEFSLKIDPLKYYENDEIYDIIKYGKLSKPHFNSMIIDNLNHYIKYYVPKYISSFCNSDLDYSKLYFGIDDYGEITGIPYIGSIDVDYFKRKIYNSIRDNIITTDITKDYIYDNIKIKFIKLAINKSLIYSSIDEKIKKKQEKYEIMKQERDKYINEWRVWNDKLSLYSTKLIELITNKITFNEIVEYIKKNDISKIHTISQIQNITEQIADIYSYKDNPNNLLYWMCKFRDEKIDEMINKRPMKPKKGMKKINYSNELTKLHELRQKFIENNPDINYYLLEIDIPVRTSDEVFYKDIYNVIRKKIRMLNSTGEPACL